MASQSVLNTLYLYYREFEATDTQIIQKSFQELNSSIHYLSIKENDKISDLICALCTEYEREAFFAGFHTAFRLQEELRQQGIQ